MSVGHQTEAMGQGAVVTRGQGQGGRSAWIRKLAEDKAEYWSTRKRGKVR